MRLESPAKTWPFMLQGGSTDSFPVMRRVMSRFIALIFVITMATLPANLVGEDLIKNGDFRRWNGSTPSGWKSIIGASNGNAKIESTFAKVPKGVKLTGNRKTTHWRVLQQEIDVEPNSAFKLSFDGKAIGTKREQGQYDNCYVGYQIKSDSGKDYPIKPVVVSTRQWKRTELTVATPDDASSLRVMIFLSKTGELHVRDIRFEVISENVSSFDILVNDMQEHYSFFQHKQIDWQALTTSYKAAADSAKTEEQFIAAIKPMLAKLKDPHVWIENSQGKIVSVWSRSVKPNFDMAFVAKQLTRYKQLGKSALLGKTSDGFGYVAIADLMQPPKFYDQIVKSLGTMENAKGIIVDVRANSGGSEIEARKIARFFNDKEVVYAKHMYRGGPTAKDFGPVQSRTLQSSNAPFTKPVVCLVGPRCVSSGEGLAAMMAAINHVTLVGSPTRGASGNPMPVKLPNGTSVHYSRWVSLLPDGTPIEGTGIIPDIKVKHGPGDPAFERAVKLLRVKSSTK